MRSIEYLQYDDTCVNFHRGQVIFKEGDPGDCMYVIRSGAIDIRVGGKPVELLRAGDFLGEMALLDDVKRSATARALTASELVPIDRRRFRRLVDSSPFFARDILNVMSQRLRRMNSEISMMYKIIENMQGALAPVIGSSAETVPEIRRHVSSPLKKRPFG